MFYEIDFSLVDVTEQITKDNVEILSFASIKDLTALKIPDNDDNWCILVRY